METWFSIILSLCIAFLLKSLFSLLWSPSSSTTNSKNKLPPGPPAVTLIGNILWLTIVTKSSWELEPIIRTFHLKYGPLITLRIGSRSAIFVASHALAHQALVQNGAVFSDRPKASPTTKIVTSNQHNIGSAAYGPTWRVLRRNLTSEILHPSRVKSYSHARRWVLGVLVRRLAGSDSGSAAAVRVVDHLQYAMVCLLVVMCFGDKLDENQIKQIETVQRRMLLSFGRSKVLNFWPRLSKILYRNRWKELIQMREDLEGVLIPLIRSRIEFIKQKQQQDGNDSVVAYVDTLVNLQLPEEENRKLTEVEMVTLCSEFLNGGTDTTSTALQWIMANLVKHPQIQAKLYEEISGVVGPPPASMEHVVVKEEDLQNMPYLKAVVLESLRRHPPGHFVLPHSVTEDVELDGYVVPKNATVVFTVAELGWDPKVWSDPMEFKPERFLSSSNEGFDVTGSREIKMMPFGAGRRICPASALALLHLEYFVANLVWYFEWTAADGDEVDLSEKQEFNIVMKNPLRAHISPRHTHAF